MKKEGGRRGTHASRGRAAGAGRAASAGIVGHDDAPYPILRIRRDGTLAGVNGAAEIGFPGLSSRGASHPVVANALAAAAGMGRGTRFVDREEAIGERVWSQRIVREADGFTVYMTDVSEIKLAREELRLLETHDRLTTLLNRGSFLDRLSEVVHAAIRYKFPLSVALCDVDGMHRINGEFGHRAGDEVLSSVGRTLKACLRAEDIAGRFGGDEFAVAFPHTSAYDAVIGIARIRARLEKLSFGKPLPGAFRVTLSFGVADLSPGDMNERGLLEAAMRSMMEAKGR